MPVRILDSLKLFAAAGAGGSLIGAITRESVLTWTGVGVASGSAVLTALITGYHKLGEARRDELAKDRAAIREEVRKDHQSNLEEIRAFARLQIEMQAKIDAAGKSLRRLETRMEQVQCKFLGQPGHRPIPPPESES